MSHAERVPVLMYHRVGPARNAWESLPVPNESQPVMKAAKGDGDKPDDCSYPRWNPRGVKYGFISREGLEGWYL